MGRQRGQLGLGSPPGPPKRRKWQMIFLVAPIGFAIIMVCAAIVWIFLKATAPPAFTTEGEARAVCERAVIDEMQSPTGEVTFGKQTAKEVRGGREWIVSGKAKSALGGGHAIEARYNCTIAEGALVRQTGPRQDDWITITQH